VEQVLVAELEKREIRAQVDRILKDLGRPEPPLVLADVRALLSLDLQYYSRADPGLIAELTHRFNLLAKKKLPDLGNHLISALAKSRLCAFWVPESSRILIDSEVPTPKHRWIEAHEITHSITKWHKDFLLGDNAKTLDPACHAIIEAEANYGAGRILFLQDQFSLEARSLPLSFTSIIDLSKRYKNSIVSTFWRTVEERDPEQAVFGVISIHPLYPSVGEHDGPRPWRYFIRSPAFLTQFSSVSADDVFAVVKQEATCRRVGPVFSADHVFTNAIGDDWEYRILSHSTGHALLTLGYPVQRRSIVVAATPRPASVSARGL
jgi:Zn-dependent peptidase ImmA (M78 family)